VTYHGLLPDLFREGQGVVAEGYLLKPSVFHAESVLAKHDEKYMPKEVADQLKKQGVYRRCSVSSEISSSIMALGFAGLQILASFWGVIKNNNKFQILGRSSAFLQGGFLGAAFLTLILAFLVCDFSILTVALHDHTQLPWYYRIAATWGNHEGSLLLFVLILSKHGCGSC
jgi:hypothetical protein